MSAHKGNHCALQQAIITISIVIAAAFVASVVAADEVTPTEDAIVRLAAATSAHPDDPDLAWAYAKALSRAGQAQTAALQMEQYAARWPTRRDDVHLATGRMLFEAGRAQDALGRLEAAVQHNPKSGIARFFRALALRELGRRQEARLELIRSATMSPELLPDSTLLLSIDAFATGDDKEGVELAQKVIALDPTSDAAARARMLLEDKDLKPSKHPFHADAYAGFSYDDNVTLASSEDEIQATEEKDFFGRWGLGLGWRQPVGDRTQLMAGYRFDQREYDEQDAFDMFSNAVYLSGLYRFHRQAAVRLDVIGWNTRQDGEQYQWAGTVRPSLLVALPQGAGLLRGFANFELIDYSTDLFDPSLDASGITMGGGVEWTVPIPKVGGTTGVTVAYYDTNTNAKKSELTLGDFDGDYDLRSLQLRVLVLVPVWWEIELGAEGRYTRNRYKHENFADFFNQFLTVSAADIEIGKRRDHVVGGRIFLSRPIHRYVSVELEWKPSWRMSNLDSYDYKRHMVGMIFRVQTN